MHASICRQQTVTGSTDEVIQVGRLLTRALADAPGFVSYALLDAGQGLLVSLSVFDTEAELLDAETLLGTWMADHLPTSSAITTQVTSGEIIVQRGM